MVVIGGGPAGLTAGLEYCKSDGECTVLESDPHYLGGLARTVERNGARFDLGGHRFFSKNQEIVAWWKEVLPPEDFIEVDRRSRIFYGGKFFEYPLRPLNALINLGVLDSFLCILTYLYRSVNPIKPEVSFRDWVTNRFGDRLFRIFFRSYTEKVWGMRCEEISADWAAQRIKGLSLRIAVMNSIGLSGGSRGSGKVVKTLTDRFLYPRKGPGMMWETVARRIESHGSKVLLDRTVTSVMTDGRRAVRVVSEDRDGNRHEHACGALISSMPLREFVRNFDPAAPPDLIAEVEKLRYRDFLIVALTVKGTDIFPDNWIYIHDPAVKAGRVQNYGNWSADMVPEGAFSVLGVEYFCNQQDDLWNQSDASLRSLAVKELTRLGLLGHDKVVDGAVVRVKKAYPVYDEHYKSVVEKVRSWLDGFENIWTVGRNGMHHYNNQDHSMMTALLATRNCLGQSDDDPWLVNTDAEYLEERRVPSPVS